MADDHNRMLTPEELEWAITHAQKIHQLEEDQRDRMRRSTDLETLRHTLREIGMPDADIDKALADLPAALAQHKAKKKSGRAAALGAVIAVVMSAGIFFMQSATKGPPLVFIAVETDPGTKVMHQTWHPDTELTGSVEEVLAKALTSEGFQLVEHLPTAKRQAIYLPQAKTPDHKKLKKEVGARYLVQGRALCSPMLGEMPHPLKNRVGVKFTVMDLEKGGQVALDPVAEVFAGKEEDCDAALIKKTQEALPQVLEELKKLRSGG